MTDKITPFLWFNDQAEDAARFYVSLFPDSEITGTTRHGDETAPAFIVSFTLMGRPYTAMNGGPNFKLNEAFSLSVKCRDQEEIDRYWTALTSNGGAESMCGWCRDRFGLFWQIIPEQLPQLLGLPDPVAASRARDAMLAMRKFDIAALKAAAQAK